MYNRESIRTLLIELIDTETGKQFPNLQESAPLRGEELGLDSVDVVSIVSQVERKLHIRLTHEELMQLVTVADFLNLLETKLATPPAPQQAAA